MLNATENIKQGDNEKDQMIDKENVRDSCASKKGKNLECKKEINEKGTQALRSGTTISKPSDENKVDDIILRYQNTTVRNSDLLTLIEPNWISDSIISFWLEYIQNEVVGINNGVLLMNPAMSQFIKMGEKNDLVAHLNEMNVWLQDYLILPVNNNNVDKQGGSHWSLLLYCRNKNEWYHLDSLNRFNSRHAMTLAENLNQYLEFNTSPTLIDISCTKQLDNHNCGEFILCYIQEIINRISLKLPLDAPCSHIAGNDPKNMRQMVLEKITEMNCNFNNVLGKGNEMNKINTKTKSEAGMNVKDPNAIRSKKEDGSKRTEYKKTCFYWVKGDCKKKQECKFGHPQLCPDIMLKGECPSTSCSLYHPKMCRSSISQGYCSKGRSCYFTHIQLISRKSNGNDHKRGNLC